MDKYTDEQLSAGLERAQKDYDDIYNSVIARKECTKDERLTLGMLNQFIGEVQRELELRDSNTKAEIYQQWKMKQLQTLPQITLPPQ